MEIFRANQGRAGLANPNLNGIDELDPRNNCFPAGVPRIMISGDGLFQIIHLPDEVLILFEQGHWVRRIYMDGRGHPEDFPPSWMGHSIGRWDGDTLVVDTVGLNGNGEKWLDAVGHPHTDALHIVGRWRRVDQDTLQVDFTFDDPKAYTKPWDGQWVFTLKPDWEIAEYVHCEDHLRNEHLQEFLREAR